MLFAKILCYPIAPAKNPFIVANFCYSPQGRANTELGREFLIPNWEEGEEGKESERGRSRGGRRRTLPEGGKADWAGRCSLECARGIFCLNGKGWSNPSQHNVAVDGGNG